MTTTVRGFLYRQPDGTLVLCDQPNLKSCCVKNNTQLEIEGTFTFSEGQAITLAGTLEGQTLYRAEQINETASFPWLTLIFALVLALGGLRWHTRR